MIPASISRAFVALIATHAVVASAQAPAQDPVAPVHPPSKVDTFMAREGVTFSIDAKDMGRFNVSPAGSAWTDKNLVVKITAMRVSDILKPDEVRKCIRFRGEGFYASGPVAVYVDEDEIGSLLSFFNTFETASAAFKPEKDKWQRVEFKSRGGLTFALEAYDNKRDLRIGFLDRETYMETKERAKMREMIAAAAELLKN